MAMPLAGTFDYAGLVPGKTDFQSGRWQLKERSWAALPELSFVERHLGLGGPYRELVNHRLVGLQPTLRIRGGDLILEATGRDLAHIRTATIPIDSSLVEYFEEGDLLTLVRTNTADVAVSLLRDGRLVCALGAVTIVPIGDVLHVRASSPYDFQSPMPNGRCDREMWVEVSKSDETVRLRVGDERRIGDYSVTVIRCREDGCPGKCESVAISLHDAALNAASVHSSRLLAGPNAGLKMMDW